MARLLTTLIVYRAVRVLSRAATMSLRAFYSGELGDPSVRYRLHVRKPARWAAAAARIEPREFYG